MTPMWLGTTSIICPRLWLASAAAKRSKSAALPISGLKRVVVDDIVPMLTAGSCPQVGRAVHVADAETRQIGHDRRGVVEAESAVELETIGGARDRQRNRQLSRARSARGRTPRATQTAAASSAIGPVLGPGFERLAAACVASSDGHRRLLPGQIGLVAAVRTVLEPGPSSPWTALRARKTCTARGELRRHGRRRYRIDRHARRQQRSHAPRRAAAARGRASVPPSAPRAGHPNRRARGWYAASDPGPARSRRASAGRGWRR